MPARSRRIGISIDSKTVTPASGRASRSETDSDAEPTGRCGRFNSVSGSGAVALNWAGVPFSQTAVMNGQYTFWGYEHIMWRSTITGVKSTFATNLKNNLLAATSATLNPNVALGDMQVSRTGDGGPIINPLF